MKMAVWCRPLLAWLVSVNVIVVVIGFFDFHTLPNTITATLTATMFVEGVILEAK
jgi:hypothetical protein